MARPRVRLNGRGVKDLLRDPGVVAHMEERMGRALSTAQADAPVDTGAYRDSLHLETVANPTRTVVRLVADVDYSLAVEAKTGTLTRALDSAGGRS